MITGIATADREAVLRLSLLGPDGRQRKVEAMIDTGFDGWLSLPPDLITALGLPWRRRSRALLADGSESLFDIYEGVVLWDRRRRRVPVDETHTIPLIGMALLDGSELKIQVRTGGKVSVRRLS
jgi:clan AA aspartic protease